MIILHISTTDHLKFMILNLEKDPQEVEPRLPSLALTSSLTRNQFAYLTELKFLLNTLQIIKSNVFHLNGHPQPVYLWHFPMLVIDLTLIQSSTHIMRLLLSHLLEQSVDQLRATHRLQSLERISLTWALAKPNVFLIKLSLWMPLL